MINFILPNQQASILPSHDVGGLCFLYFMRDGEDITSKRVNNAYAAILLNTYFVNGNSFLIVFICIWKVSLAFKFVLINLFYDRFFCPKTELTWILISHLNTINSKNKNSFYFLSHSYFQKLKWYGATSVFLIFENINSF